MESDTSAASKDSETKLGVLFGQKLNYGGTKPLPQVTSRPTSKTESDKGKGDLNVHGYRRRQMHAPVALCKPWPARFHSSHP